MLTCAFGDRRAFLAPNLEVHNRFHRRLSAQHAKDVGEAAFLLFREFHSCSFLAAFEESLYEVSEPLGVLVFKPWSDG